MQPNSDQLLINAHVKKRTMSTAQVDECGVSVRADSSIAQKFKLVESVTESLMHFSLQCSRVHPNTPPKQLAQEEV
jgi:hypothetical protein